MGKGRFSFDTFVTNNPNDQHCAGPAQPLDLRAVFWSNLILAVSLIRATDKNLCGTLVVRAKGTATLT